MEYSLCCIFHCLPYVGFVRALYDCTHKDPLIASLGFEDVTIETFFKS